ncbi:MAG: glycosyltransferase, partial [Candidatus Sericytochromatia bacterium]
PLEAEAALAAADLYLLPLADGASARRTSLMNALAAGLPVVSTVGVNTDPTLFPEAALTLVPAGDSRAFAEAAVALARDPAARERLGVMGRALHDERFSWDVLGPQWLALLESVT